jgi:type IV pilus assembly protein PilE
LVGRENEKQAFFVGHFIVWARGNNEMIRGKEGVTLLEVMVVVVIVGILAAVAIPAYNNYVTRARRSDAFTALETVRAAQEMYRAEQGGYAINFAALAGCDAGMAGDNYTLSLQDIVDTSPNDNLDDDNAYWVWAQPQQKQAGDHSLQVDQDGNKQYNDGSWNPVNSWEDIPR